MDERARHEQFLILIEGHKKILYKVAQLYCSNPADRPDAVQEILIHLWLVLPQYDPRRKFSTWMYKVAINVAISFDRKERTLRKGIETIATDGIDFEAADAAALRESDEIRWLKNEIRQLDALNKALMLLFLEGHTYEEMAEILGISETLVGTKLNRLKDKLQKLYQEAAKEAAR